MPASFRAPYKTPSQFRTSFTSYSGSILVSWLDSSYYCRAQLVHSQRDQLSLLHSIRIRPINDRVIRQNLRCLDHNHVCGTLCNRVSSLEVVPTGPTASRSDSGQLPRPTLVVTSSGWNREGENQPGQPPSEVYRLREVSLFPFPRPRKCPVASYHSAHRLGPELAGTR